jgi:hypothetical protein
VGSREIAMTISNATFAPLTFTMERGNRSIDCGFFDMIEGFRGQAVECEQLANRWGGEAKRQYEELARQWLEVAELAERRQFTAVSIRS